MADEMNEALYGLTAEGPTFRSIWTNSAKNSATRGCSRGWQNGPAHHVRGALPLYSLARRRSVHSCSQYVTRPPFWHTKRTPPSWEITTATDPGSAPASL
jgi:hypothetical protein